MAYEPTEWKSGDVVTSTKLNKIENGIANAEVFYIQFEIAAGDPDPVVTCNHTPEEIVAAKTAGKIVLAKFLNPNGYLYDASSYQIPDSGTSVLISFFYADSGDDLLVGFDFLYDNGWAANTSSWTLTPAEE